MAVSVLPTQVVQLPCIVCGQHAVTLSPPELPPKAIKNIVRGVDVLDSLLGAFGDVELPELNKEQHPLLQFPADWIARFMGVVHPECVAKEFEQRTYSFGVELSDGRK